MTTVGVKHGIPHGRFQVFWDDEQLRDVQQTLEETGIDSSEFLVFKVRHAPSSEEAP
jgi:hypothetical protein